MKKLLFLFVMFSTSLFAQKQVTKFMGIPVDGFKKEMIQKLEAKGFEYDRNDDCLNGEFNGEDVFIYVVTNNNKVWRIALADKYPRDEQQIRIRFNNLVSQFSRNRKYRLSYLYEHPFLSEDEDIGYEMSVNKKQYACSFIQNPLPLAKDSIQQIRYVENKIKDYGKWDEYISLEKSKKEAMFLDVLFEESEASLKRTVWFCIQKTYSKYFMFLYYDNENNRANGEDL